MPTIASFRTSTRSPLLQVVKTSVAGIAAWLLSSLLLGQPLPIFAAIAALLVVQPSVTQSLAKGIERSIGVIVGVVLAYLAGAAFGTSSWVVFALIVVSLLVAWALKLNPGSSNQIPISAMLVIALGAQTPGYAVDRILETVIGAVVGLLVNAAIVPPVLVGPAHSATVGLAGAIATSLERLSSALTAPTSREDLATILAEARALRPLQRAAERSLDTADESLFLNPRASVHRRTIEADRMLLQRLSALVTRTIGMTRTIHDGWVPDLVGDPVVEAISLELDRAAHDLRLLAVGERRADAGPPITSELPALTAPLVIARPDPRHWILVGSLMEDIRRVREEIIGGPLT